MPTNSGRQQSRNLKLWMLVLSCRFDGSYQPGWGDPAAIATLMQATMRRVTVAAGAVEMRNFAMLHLEKGMT